MDKKEFYRHIGVMLADAREKSGYTQNDMLEFTEHSSRTSISHMENGASNMTAYELYVYCKLCNLSPSDLFNGGDGTMNELLVPKDMEEKDIEILQSLIPKYRDPLFKRLITSKIKAIIRYIKEIELEMTDDE